MNFQGKIMVGLGDLIATIDNQAYQVTREHPLYNRIFEAFKNNDADEFVKWVNEQQCLENYVCESCTCKDSGVTVEDGVVKYNGVEVHNVVSETINNMMRDGLDFDPMVKFLERAIKSNSKRVVDELFRFLQACKLTITEDGCFLAYKTVRSDFYDKYSGKFLNTVGSELRMDKWQVDDDCNRTCSHGFHVGALAYAGPGGAYNSPGDKVIIVKVAPEDVVSVPSDYSGQKLRTCAYTVVGEFKGVLQPTVYSGKVGDDYGKVKQRAVKLVEICACEMLVDGLYAAYYTGNDGEGKWRYFVVEEVRDDCVLASLTEPEESVGGLRRFKFDNFGMAYEWDGQTDVEDYFENHPEYDDDYSDEDEDDWDDDDDDCDCDEEDCDRCYW